MPKLKDLIAEKIARLESVPDELVSQIEKIQVQLLKEVLTLIDKLETENGKILLNSHNLAQIQIISNKLKESLFGGDYSDVIESFAGEVVVQAGMTNEYFEKAFPEYAPDPIFKEILHEQVKNIGSLYSEGAIEQQLLQPIREQLFTSISSGSTLNNMIDAVSGTITGNKLQGEGKLMRYVKGTSYDAFAITDRGYSNVISEALGAEFFHYVGGLLKDSRPFCVERNDKYFHKKEVEAWPNHHWQGERDGTNAQTIFSFAGGYNCKHSVLPVSISSVPPEVIARAKAKGFIK